MFLTGLPPSSSVAELLTYLQDEKCYFNYAITHDSVVKRIFFMWPSQAQRWLDVGDVVCFDSTFSVNTLDLTLSAFSVKNEFGLNEPLGYCLHFNKGEEDYAWIFEQQMQACSELTGHAVKPKVRVLFKQQCEIELLCMHFVDVGKR
jgi:hypothetical protein